MKGLFNFFVVGAAVFGMSRSLAVASESKSSVPTVILKSIPHAIEWMNQPKAFSMLAPDSFAITAVKGTDLYPVDGKLNATAPMLLFQADTSFVLTAQVTVDFKEEFDGGFLVAYVDPEHWIKLLFEKSHYGSPSVCSNVTSGTTDDVVNGDIHGNNVWLRMTKSGTEITLYDSVDGKHWTYIRVFQFRQNGPLKIGFASQAPEAEQCRSVFSRITYTPKAPGDFWSGEPGR